MKSLPKFLQERLLILDGGMGSMILAKNPTLDDFGGEKWDGCPEILNVRRKHWIQEIHQEYFKAGAQAVETNTFGCNEIVLSEFGLQEETYSLNVAAAKLAKEVAHGFGADRFVIGSVGPGTKILTLGQTTYETMFKSYFTQMQGLIDGGVDALLIETCQDIGQVKLSVRAAKKAMEKARKKLPIWCQVTIETTGTMLVGTDMQAALIAIEALGVDVIGLNCATGPDEMRQHLNVLSKQSPVPLSCLPNAGIPESKNGQVVYPLCPEAFAEKVQQIVKDFNVSIVGGCCGTTPLHIQELARCLGTAPSPKNRSFELERSVTSLYSSTPLNLEPRPLYVGERTNANGSKKFREHLLANDFEGMIALAKEQQKEGAHILDVCTAYVSRPESDDMDKFLRPLITQIQLPIMIDSTETNVIEKSLQAAPGKCIVNSINFEDGNDRPRTVLNLCKEYGAAIVALTIDESGMAKTAEKKVEIARRIVQMVCGEFGIHQGDLIIDPLTFTLGSGDEEFRKSAIETINAIEQIKKEFPLVKTMLGLSNVSFGLNPYPRQMLNSMMLYYSVQKGLDLAILNASKILPVSKMSEDDKTIFSDLIFDRRKDGYDPLKKVLEKYSDKTASVASNKVDRKTLPVEERLKLDIIDGEKHLINDDLKEAIQKYPPLDIINKILLDGMRVVGVRFGAGEMQLPFVLESAEAMKAGVRFLEPHMEKKETYSKGKIILATVKGDVHDIGKNLVDIILSNNGYHVLNLGIKQHIESIYSEFKKHGADAIGLSGLLVKSTVIMKDNLVYLDEHSEKVPIILGGAALTRGFVEGECRSVYKGSVHYAEDAFAGLKIMDVITSKDANALKQLNESSQEEQKPKIEVVQKASAGVELNEFKQSSWIKKNPEHVPTPPFWGTKLVEAPVDHIFDYLDEFALIRSRWGFQKGQMSEGEFDKVLQEKAYPTLEKWREKIQAEKLLHPKAIYGYFPVMSQGDSLKVFDPEAYSKRNTLKEISTFQFPRQKSGRRLCISDYFLNQESGKVDVLGIQLVTMGESAGEHAQKMYKDNEYSSYFYFHGLGTELTEAYAEFLHKKIRSELGIVHKDAPERRQLFSQGYQGSRFSFGYPACPDLKDNELILNLLDAKRIGVTLSENFQMDPELSTSALVTWHPQARYFSV